mgnify:CR=1 FL=1
MTEELVWLVSTILNYEVAVGPLVGRVVPRSVGGESVLCLRDRCARVVSLVDRQFSR